VHFLRTLDIFVLASRALPDHEEHDSQALLEAMSCGLPCIATDVGRNTDLLKGDCGVLLPRDKQDHLIDAIVDLADDPIKRRRNGRAARQFVEHYFDVRRVAERRATLLTGVSKQ
jgi:glycosyltransferase involved in cell wall biosynthesis